MEKQIVKCYKRVDFARLPKAQTDGAFGFDVYAAEAYQIAAKGMGTVDTGLTMEVPNEYALRIVPRSGLAVKMVTVGNSPGTIDSDYRGPVKVIIYNLSDSPKIIEIGDRIAQCYLERKIPTRFVEVESMDDFTKTERGTGGFGSTGR
jgi:deoxyuridine 5'-triphosphate nucleotidohydrolase